jgi:hypothetical protein
MQLDILIDAFRDIRIRLDGVEAEAARFRDIAAPVLAYLDSLYWPGDSDFSRVSLIGSWSRETAVLGLSDFNITYEMPTSLLPDVQQSNAFINEIYLNLAKRFENVERRPHSRSIAVSLKKGTVIDVRPYFWMKSGDMGFPDETFSDGWRRIYPMLARDALLRLDPIERKNLLVLCRATRVWRAAHSVPISGALIDTLGLEFISKAAHRRKDQKYQDCLMRDFLGFLADRNPIQDAWRISGDNNLVRRTGNFETYAAAAHTVAQFATGKASDGQERAVVAAWRYLFKDFYSIY